MLPTLYAGVSSEREKSMIDMSTGLPWETVTLTTVGRSRKVFFDLLAEARSQAMMKEEGKTIIYTSMGPEWRPFGQPRRKRPLHSVILPEGASVPTLSFVHKFIALAYVLVVQ